MSNINNKIANVELTHARHSRAVCLAPGLFRDKMRGKDKKQNLDITYKHGDETHRFIGFEPLDDTDLLFLQGITAMSGPDGKTLIPDPVSDIGVELRTLMKTDLAAKSMNAMMFRSSMSKLLREVGMMDSGSNIKSLKSSLLRLSNVTNIVTIGKSQMSFHLLSYGFKNSDLLIAINPLLTLAVLGVKSNTYIDMPEIRKLKSSSARFIHQRLCGWIDPGQSRDVSIDVMCGYAWHDETSSEAMRKRRERARKALIEIESVGWTIAKKSRAVYSVKRPAKS